MLRTISISNYALISDLHIEFQPGFSVITGETGAGKSIILGALGLVMGQRADSKAITQGEQKCIIEAEFDISAYPLQNFFTENDLDYNPQHCIIRRELTASGKSRSFVNDTPIALNTLKELAAQLIDIHSQHENLLLNSDRFQLNVVDTVARNAALRAEYKAAFQNYGQISKQLATLRETANTQRADADYINFQYQQLADAKLQAGEMAELEQEMDRLTHAEEIRTEAGNCFTWIDDENGINDRLKNCIAAMRKISKYLPGQESLEERLESVHIELKDIAGEIGDIAECTEYDPQRQQIVAERMDLLNSLLQKHRLQTEEELIALQNDLAQKMQRMDSFDEEIAALEKQQAACLKTLQEKAELLTKSRKAVKNDIEQQITTQLTTLGIPHPQLQIAIAPLPDYTENGKDDLQFLFAANKNQTPRNVAEIASGGEISRVMLCIKSMLTHSQALPTIIFDEIDTGVSGEIADSMGNIMQKMAGNMQVISITHLPQISAKGAYHYKVYKIDRQDRTETHIKQLDYEERIREIAQMMSGSDITQAAIENARHLLHSNGIGQ